MAQSKIVSPFDRKVLMQQTMNDASLAAEVLGLFRSQLEALKAAEWRKLDLRFEMHKLKGAAAAVGAKELEALAKDWQVQGDDLQPRLLVAIARFQAAAK